MRVRVFAWQAWKASRRPIRKAAQTLGGGEPADSRHVRDSVDNFVGNLLAVALSA
jgi:hypothetical protein